MRLIDYYVRILDVNNSLIGSGFMVDNRWILTCKHVVENWEKGAEISVCFPNLNEKKCLVSLKKKSKNIDFAILEILEESFDIMPLKISQSQNLPLEGEECHIYYNKSSAFLGWNQAIIRGMVMKSFFQADINGNPVIRIEGGHSGTFITNKNQDEIVGIVCQADRESGMIFNFLPISYVFPELPSSLLLDEKYANNINGWYTGQNYDLYSSIDKEKYVLKTKRKGLSYSFFPDVKFVFHGKLRVELRTQQVLSQKLDNIYGLDCRFENKDGSILKKSFLIKNVLNLSYVNILCNNNNVKYEKNKVHINDTSCILQWILEKKEKKLFLLLNEVQVIELDELNFKEITYCRFGIQLNDRTEIQVLSICIKG